MISLEGDPAHRPIQHLGYLVRGIVLREPLQIVDGELDRLVEQLVAPAAAALRVAATPVFKNCHALNAQYPQNTTGQAEPDAKAPAAKKDAKKDAKKGKPPAWKTIVPLVRAEVTVTAETTPMP